MSSRVAVFNQGRIEQVGTPREIYDQPDHHVRRRVRRHQQRPRRRSCRSDLLGVRQHPLGAPRAHPRVAVAATTVADGEVSVDGTVTDVQYLGAECRVRVRPRRRRPPSRQRAERRARWRGRGRSRPPGLAALRGHSQSQKPTPLKGRRPNEEDPILPRRWSRRWRSSPLRCGSDDSSEGTGTHRRHRDHGRARETHGSGHRDHGRRQRDHGRAARSTTSGPRTPTCSASAEGAGEHRRLGRLRRGRLHRSRRTTGSRRSRTMTSCQVNVKIGATSDEMVQLMQSGEYDGVSASGDATTRLIAGRRGRRDRPGRVPQLRRHLRAAEAAAVEQRRRQAVRHPARPWRQPAGVQHRGVRRRRPRLVGRRCSTAGSPADGADLGVRQPDLHRRRGAVPDGHPARARHHRPVRARPDPVRRGHRAARSSRRTSPASTGR